ncbi:MAG: RES domain-containing protein [Acidobacteriia bacterium]|nr:RES domain-containing protein [Terriglobia bacterium]
MRRSAPATADFTGATLAGGRWNPIGTPKLYTGRYLSLACIEVPVHLDKGQLPRDYVWSSTELPETPEILRCENLSNVVVPGRGRFVGPRRQSSCCPGSLCRHPRRVQCPAQSQPHRLHEARVE